MNSTREGLLLIVLGNIGLGHAPIVCKIQSRILKSTDDFLAKEPDMNHETVSMEIIKKESQTLIRLNEVRILPLCSMQCTQQILRGISFILYMYTTNNIGIHEY